MSDHYRTLGLQPNASKSDIKNAYFRLAHRYHPDHHTKADAAGRAAAAAAFRRVKDAYDVLYDDGRRALYDYTIRPSSSASSGQYKNQQGQYNGGGGSARSSGSHTWEREVQEKRRRAEREAREKEEREAQEKKAKAEREAKLKAEREAREEKLREALERKYKAEREAEEKKWKERKQWDKINECQVERRRKDAEFDEQKKKWEVKMERREAALESTWKNIAREQDHDGISFSVEWEEEWALLWEQVIRRRRYRGTTEGTYWKAEIDALYNRVEQRRRVSNWLWERARTRRQGDGSYSSSSNYRKQKGQYIAASSTASNGQGRYNGASSSSTASNGQGRYNGASSSSSSASDVQGRHGGTCSPSTASGHGVGYRSRRPPRPMAGGGAAHFLCCAGVLGASALLWFACLWKAQTWSESRKKGS